MKRYWPLLAIVLVLAAVVCMSQYADSTQRRYEESARQAKAASVAERHNGETANNAKDAYKPPVWAKYVTFPEGVGAWAIIITLLAIAWQSIETRQAASIAEKALVLQYRPRVVVRTIRLHYPDEPLSVTLQIVNSGGTPAHIVNADVELSWLYTSKWDNDTKIWASKTSFAPFDLAGGGRTTLTIPCEDSRVVLTCAKLPTETGKPQSQFLVCRGNIGYVDKGGIDRITEFRRVHHFATESFVPDASPEYEYED